MEPVGKALAKAYVEREAEILAAKAVLAARIRLAQIGVVRNKVGKRRPL